MLFGFKKLGIGSAIWAQEAPRMSKADEKRDFYLAKAKEAEENAAKSMDAGIIASAKTIADGYRSLAAVYGKLKL